MVVETQGKQDQIQIDNKKLFYQFLYECGNCGHSLEFHTSIYGLKNGKCFVLVDSYADGMGRHRENICKCSEYEPPTPIDLCLRIEEERSSHER